MRDKELKRRQQQRLVAQSLGVSADQPRIFDTQVRATGMEPALLDAPFIGGSVSAVQTPSGDLYFMVDLDTVDNGNVIG